MFEQYKLPYTYESLEPTIDALTMKTHYSKHHAAYTAKLNELAEDVGVQDMEITELLANLSQIEDDALRNAIKNNGGGFYNHNLYFQTIGPNGGGEPRGALKKKIDSTFGSFESFKEKMAALAIKQFGSGWAWLSVTPEGELVLSNSGNQDNPISLGTGNTPILAIDVWEHAYYLKYRHMRAVYAGELFGIVDWEAVEKLYEEAIKK